MKEGYNMKIQKIILACTLALAMLAPSFVYAAEETDTVQVTKVSISEKFATLRYGEKLKLSVTVSPKNATKSVVGFKTDSDEYVKISDEGVVTATKAGIGQKVK